MKDWQAAYDANPYAWLDCMDYLREEMPGPEWAMAANALIKLMPARSRAGAATNPSTLITKGVL